MPVVRTEYQTGETLEALLQQDLGGTLSFPLELLGEAITPDTDGTCLLTDGTTTVASGVADKGPPPTFATTPTQLGAVALGLAYEARWTFDIDGEPRTFRQRVGIVRWAPACPLSHTNLVKGRPVLLRLLQGTGHDTMDTWIETGWTALQHWLRRQGDRVHLVVDPSDLYELATAFAVVELLEDLVLNADPMGTIANALTDWRKKKKDLQDSEILTYDVNDSDDVVEDTRAARGPVYLSSYSGWQGAL